VSATDKESIITRLRIACSSRILCSNTRTSDNLNTEDDDGVLALDRRERITTPRPAARCDPGGQHRRRLERPSDLERFFGTGDVDHDGVCE
jgi:hypothetical protein